MKKVRKKKCKNCSKYFTPEREMQTTCNFECAIEWANKPKAKKAYQIEQKKLLKEEYPDKSKLKQKAQYWFNKFIRLRDKDLPCISCGHIHGRQFHAGHFKPAGANPQIRFDESNVHKQCSICNNYKSGNLVLYRENLIKKIGLEEVERLESDKSVKKYSAEDYRNIIETYKNKCKELENDK